MSRNPSILIYAQKDGSITVEIPELNINANFDEMKNVTDFIKNLQESEVI